MAAEAGTGGVPRWLLDCKESITRTREWDYFVDELHDAVAQQLTESHVDAFSDLTDAERVLFLDRASRAIRNGEAYDIVHKTVSHHMDQHLSNAVARQQVDEESFHTKSDLFLDGAQEGILCVLRTWPDLKFKLHACFNNPLPKQLRTLTWKLFLENSKVRKMYNDILSSNPRKAISPKDLEISRKCERLLMTEPTFSELNGSIGAFYAMKAVLSYRHTRTGFLTDADYLLTIPLLCATVAKISRSEPATVHLVALIVEEYFTLMDSRPDFMVANGSEAYESSMKQFSESVASHLLQKSPDVAQVLTKIYLPSQDQIVATEKGSLAVISGAVISLLGPLIQSMFVGYLNVETLLYIWDQYVIGMDRPGYHENLLPAMAAAHIMLLKEKLKDCSSPTSLEAALKKESPALKASQFQYQINQHFYKELNDLLTQGEQTSLPVLDPTQGKSDSWVHWHKDKLPARTGASERQQARLAREEERERQVNEYREREAARRLQEQQEKDMEYQEALADTMKARQQVTEERRHLYDALEKERQMRIDAERRAAKEIERLQAEIKAMKQQPAQRSPVPSTRSMGSIWSLFPGAVAPPGSPASHTPSIRPAPTPRSSLAPKSSNPTIPPPSRHTQPSRHSEPASRSHPASAAPSQPDNPTAIQAQEAMLDFMTRVANGFQKVANGNPHEKAELDDLTKNDLQRGF